MLLPVQGAAAQGAVASKLDRTFQAAFQKCGARLQLNPALSRAAAAGLKETLSDELLRRSGYRAKAANLMTFTYQGDLNWLGQNLLKKCAQLRQYSEYGFATDGIQGALVTAQPGQVDLTRSRVWLEQFLSATNKARAQGRKCGDQTFGSAPPLRWDHRLEAAAARHVHDMVALNFRGHVHPVDGTRAQQRAEAFGFRGAVGENISYGPTTPQEAVVALLSSPDHCKNLMNPRWTLFGGAVGNGTTQTLFATYWVQVFGDAR